MWRVYFPKQNQGAVARASIIQSLVIMSRRISLLLGVSVVVLFVLTSPPKPGGNGWQMLAITVAWLAASIGAYYLASRHLLRAHTLLLGAAAILLPLAVAASHQPLLLTLYAGLPALAVILIGWPAGIAAVMYTAFVPGALAGAGLAPELPWIHAVVLASLAALAALVSWSAVNALLELAETGLLGLERAQVDVDEARSQRLELKQVEEDLLQATREQARL